MSALVRNAERERDELAAALAPMMASIGFYIGPNSRSLSSAESERQYRVLRLTLARARGEACPECRDTGIAPGYGVAMPCPLRHEPSHRIELPPEAIAYMVAIRDADSRPEPPGGPYRVGPPRYADELAAIGVV